MKAVWYNQLLAVDTTDQQLSEEDIVSRVVVNLDDDTSVDDVYVENIDNEIFVYVSGDPLNGFDYVKNGLDSARLTMNFTNMGKVDASYNENTRNLTMKVKKESLN